MAQRVEKNTFAYVEVADAVGNTTEVRRAVFAGHDVPDEWRLADDEDAEPVRAEGVHYASQVQDEAHRAEHEEMDVSSGAHPGGTPVGGASSGVAKKVKGQPYVSKK